MKTVILLSGGIDSAVALAMQQRLDGDHIDTLTVYYGQNAYNETRAAKALADHYRVPNTLVAVAPELFGGSALTGHRAMPTQPAAAPDATYVPARNTVLLALAAARAESIGARRIVIGANADDAAGYPDCRRAYIEAFRDVLQAGTVGHVWVDAPLIGMRKPDIIDYAYRLRVPIELTWSCYSGDETPCGSCGACILRKEALG